MAAATRESISKLGRVGTETQLVTQLVNAVSSGALDAGQARSIASNIAKEIGDASFGLNVNAKLVELLGVNGENLLEDPLTIRIKLAEDSEKQIGIVAGKMQELASPFQVLGEAALSTGILAGSAALVGGPWGAVAGTVAGLVNGVPQVINAFVNMGTASAAVVANSKMALQQQQQLLDSLDLDYEKRIAIAEAAGDLEKAERLRNQYTEDRAALLEQGKETRAAIADSFNSTDSAGKMALQEAAKKSIENRYKDDADGLALAMGARQQVIDASGLSDTQEYLLTVGLASDLDPLVISELMNQFGSDEEMMTKTFTLMDNLGNADTNRTLNVMKMFRDENGEPLLDQQADFVANIAAKSDVPEEARKYLEMFESVSRVLDAEIVLTYLNENPAAADKMLEMKEIIDSVDGKMGMDVITDLIGEENMDNFKEYEQYFNGLPDNFQKTFMTQFVTTMLLQGNEAMMDQYETWLNEPGNKGKEFTDFALDSGFITTETQKDNTLDPISDEDTGSGGSGPAASSLDDILKKLRDIRKNQIGVAKGFEASADAINKLFGGGAGINLFSGIENDMRRLGAEENLIDLIVGMSPEDFEKQKNTLFNFDKQTGEIIGFKDQLQNIGRALSAIALGQYVTDQQKSAKESRNQVLAFNQLRAAGYSVADAYEAVQDAAVASAIATGNVTRDQMNTMLQELKAAQAAMKEAARLTPEGLQEVFEDGFRKAMEAFDVKEKKLTLDYEFKIKDDKALIDEAQNQIASIQYELDDYEADLRRIENQEEAINKTYDDKLEALEKVRNANQKILDQEKGRLSVAEAITRGDLSATARAIQDLRATSASGYFSSQTDALNAGRQSALDQVRSENGLSRIEIEEKIKDLTNTIFEIEEKTLEPAQRRIDLATIELEKRISEEEVLERTRGEWEEIKTNIDLARVNSAGYKSAMDEALAVVQDVLDAWNEIEKPKETIHTIITVREGDASGGYVGGGDGNITTDADTPAVAAAKTGLTQAQTALAAQDAQRAELGRQLVSARSQYASAKSGDDKRNLQVAIDRLNREISTISSDRKLYLAAVTAAENKLAAALNPPAAVVQTSAQILQTQIAALSVAVTRAKTAMDDAQTKRDLAQRTYDMAISFADPTTAATLTKNLFLAETAFVNATKAHATAQRNLTQAQSQLPRTPGTTYMATGGFVSGPGTPTSDSVPAMLSNGEYVIKAASVNKFGKGFLDSINDGKLPGFKKGGMLGRVSADAAERRAQAAKPAGRGYDTPAPTAAAPTKSMTEKILDVAEKISPLVGMAREGFAIAGSLGNLGRGKATAEDYLTLGLGALNFIPGGRGVSAGVKAARQGSKNIPALKNFIDFKRNPNEQVLSNPEQVAVMDGYVRNAANTLFGTNTWNRSQIDNIIKSNSFGIPKGTSLVRVANESDTEILKLLRPGQSITLDRFMSVTNSSSKEFLEGMAKGTVQTGGRRGGAGVPLYPVYKFNVKSDIPGIQDINRILPTPASNVVDGLLARGQNMKLMRITTDRKTGQQTYHFDIGKGIRAKTGFQQLGGKKDNQDMIAGLIREGRPDLTPSYRQNMPGLGGYQNRSEWMPRYFANGGLVSRGTDTVPAMLSPGEYVVKSQRVKELGTKLFDSINSGSLSSVQSMSSPSFSSGSPSVSVSQSSVPSRQAAASSSNSVYNYSLSVNVASQADPNTIAQTVMAQLQRVDSQRVRNGRF
jgi:hypothetical protein